MAFFDDFGKKISNVSHAAVQKTQGMATVAKLNSDISEEQRKLNNYYYQMGRLYAQKHGNDFEPEFAEMIASSKESEKKLFELHRQIQDIKGLVRCEKCGAEVPNTVAFCSNCGASIPKVTCDNENTVVCSGCGASVDKNMKFCTKCGKQISDSINTVSESQEPKRCPNCNTEIKESSVFCTGCGTKVN